jgi:glyoxylase-like metal-dependent hydrolase (beta-lactamase superfamily II)
MIRTWIALAATAFLASAFAANAAPPATTTIQDLPLQVTEEGQHVSYDAYTWQRRELAKRLPLYDSWPTDDKFADQFKRFGLDKPPVPDQITAPVRIMKDVYLVDSHVNHTYLIDAGPAGLILIDPGQEENVAPILANIQKLGFSPSAVRWVINTHAHFDHAMADAHFQKLGAKILIGRPDVGAVEKGTQVTAKFASSMPNNYPTFKVDWPIDDGEELRLGNKMILAIATPGHTPGSTCFLLVVDHKNILFGGDTILFDYRLGDQRLSFADNVAYLASLKKVAHFLALPGGYVSYDVLLPGHGTIVMDRAYMDVLKDLRQVEWDVTMGQDVNALPFGDDYYRKLMFGRP